MIHEEGIGWRLIIDLSKEQFPVLIGGDNAAVELTKKEWNALVPLLIDLLTEFKKYENNSFGDESIILEMQKDIWIACLEGKNDSWSLKIILIGDSLSRRGIEMYWPIQSAQQFVLAMRKMWESN